MKGRRAVSLPWCDGVEPAACGLPPEGKRLQMLRCPRKRVNSNSTGWHARRWVVEACRSWLNRNRALLVRWSKKAENHLALLQLACGLIAFKKARAARLANGLQG